MKKVNPKTYLAVGLALIALSIPLAAGIVTQWPASTETWANTEILGAYGPARLAPGTELASIKVLVRNGYTSSGDVLIEVRVDGDADDCSAWQFTEYVRHEDTKNVTLKFYRERPVMGEGPMTFTVQPGYSGSGEATLIIYPAAGGGDTPGDETEPADGADGGDTDDGSDSDTGDESSEAGDGSGDPDAEELAIIEALQTLAPRLTVETLTMGIVACLMGLGFTGLGVSMRDQW